MASSPRAPVISLISLSVAAYAAVAARLCVLLRNGFLSRRQRLRQLPDLPHAHPLHLLRGESGIERLRLQKCTVLAIGQPGLVRKGYLLRICRTDECVVP